MNNNDFNVRKDLGGIPVAGYQSAPDVLMTSMLLLTKITGTQTTTPAGVITVPFKPIAALTHYLDHLGKLQESYGILVTDPAAPGTPYYAGDVDPVAGSFTVFSNSGLTTTVPSKNLNFTYYFLAPVSGNLNPDGTVTQEFRKAGGKIEDVSFQTAVTATGNGISYTATTGNVTLSFAVKGTSSSRTILFEMADPSGQFQPCSCFGVLDPSLLATQTTGGNDTAPESWQVDIPAGWSFRTRIGNVVGGNITVSGKAVLV